MRVGEYKTKRINKKMSTVLQMNNEQLSLFNFDQDLKKYEEFEAKINRELKLEPIPDRELMLRAIMKCPGIFGVKHRLFIKDQVLNHFMKLPSSRKQLNYLYQLYITTPGSGVR